MPAAQSTLLTLLHAVCWPNVRACGFPNLPCALLTLAATPPWGLTGWLPAERDTEQLKRMVQALSKMAAKLAQPHGSE